MIGMREMPVGSTGVAVACLGMAVWLWGGRRAGMRRARVLLAGGGVVGVGPPQWRRLVAELRRVRGRLGFEWWAAVAGLVLAVLGASVLPVLAGAAGVPLLRRMRLIREERRVRERRAAAVIALCALVAGEVRAGRQPGEALAGAVRDVEGPADGRGGLDGARHESPECGGLGETQAAVLAAARFGGDVPGALAAAARRPGAEGLSGLAACWRVAVDQGAGLAAGLDRLEAALRAERDQRADLRAQLAGARSTAWMLAALPVLGLGLGAALGADPLHVLLHTGTGLGCLLAGGLLEGVGMWWAARIVRGAEAA
ncbi:tight adherence protein B [Streptomyces sp. SAI-135]|nr:tight adherence protein B [Streptomyces sp. SAI-090]MDH6586290.1 tight adherence protein B [Streptomyces sp. SAI-133]MDH6618411.1 tight adherence protein B [Streptomyces sp. SAI-135]